MSTYKFYPRRTDHVLAAHFDGTLESAQRISHMVDRDVELIVDPEAPVGDQPLRMRVGEHVVTTGSYVVCDQHKNIIEVIEAWDFRDRYSSDGL